MSPRELDLTGADCWPARCSAQTHQLSITATRGAVPRAESKGSAAQTHSRSAPRRSAARWRWWCDTRLRDSRVSEHNSPWCRHSSSPSCCCRCSSSASTTALPFSCTAATATRAWIWAAAQRARSAAWDARGNALHARTRTWPTWKLSLDVLSSCWPASRESRACWRACRCERAQTCTSVSRLGSLRSTPRTTLAPATSNSLCSFS
jgi:hypothetical protein